MMHGPLKNKRKTLFGEKIKMGEENKGIIFWNLSFTELDCFLYSDVRSAVLGLKNELRDRRISLGLFDEQYNMIFKLIDRWFEDVLK